MTINEKWFRERSSRYPFQCRTDGEGYPKPEDLGPSYGGFIRAPVNKSIGGRSISHVLWGFETEASRSRFLTKYHGAVTDTL